MIYNPKHFQMEDKELVSRIVQRYNFATLMTSWEGKPIVSHLPLIFDQSRYSQGGLFGHIARANPQWKHFREASEVTAIFHGPHAYISPRWYAANPANVPTWNYAVVYIHGRAQAIHDEREASIWMHALVQQHDPDWKWAPEEKDMRKKLQEIVVFGIEIQKIEAKFKLSQNRSAEDRRSVAQALAQSIADLDRETAALMLDLLKESAAT
jgi:transcriptional regulator